MVIFIKSKIRPVCYLAMTLDGFLFKVFNYSLLLRSPEKSYRKISIKFLLAADRAGKTLKTIPISVETPIVPTTMIGVKPMPNGRNVLTP